MFSIFRLYLEIHEKTEVLQNVAQLPTLPSNAPQRSRCMSTIYIEALHTVGTSLHNQLRHRLERPHGNMSGPMQCAAANEAEPVASACHSVAGTLKCLHSREPDQTRVHYTTMYMYRSIRCCAVKNSQPSAEGASVQICKKEASDIHSRDKRMQGNQSCCNDMIT